MRNEKELESRVAELESERTGVRRMSKDVAVLLRKVYYLEKNLMFPDSEILPESFADRIKNLEERIELREPERDCLASAVRKQREKIESLEFHEKLNTEIIHRISERVGDLEREVPAEKELPKSFADIDTDHLYGKLFYAALITLENTDKYRRQAEEILEAVLETYKAMDKR